MKNWSVTLLLLIAPSIVLGQYSTEKFFYDENWDHTTDSLSASYIITYSYKDSTENSGVETKRDTSGHLISEAEYLDFEEGIKDGYYRSYYANDQIFIDANYFNDDFHGEFSSYYSSGQLKRNDIYEYGKLLTGSCYGVDGKDTTYIEYIIMPEYPGGETELMKFITDNTNYPRQARRKDIEGRVIVKFTVGLDGSVKDVSLTQSIHPLLDEEALRVINLLGKWTPGKIDGEFADTNFQIPFNFKLK